MVLTVSILWENPDKKELLLIFSRISLDDQVDHSKF